jgi:hypothetical protein
MKIGDKVKLYWDGKSGRGVDGIVTATHNGHHITVRFVPWLDDAQTIVESRFRVGRGYQTSCRKFFHGWARDLTTKEGHGYYRIAKPPAHRSNLRW